MVVRLNGGGPSRGERGIEARWPHIEIVTRKRGETEKREIKGRPRDSGGEKSHKLREDL